MYIGILMRLLFGYVRIEVEGYYIERFINICTNKKILIWNLKREDDVRLFLNMGISDFKKISEICKKTQCRVKIKKKKGIPFLLNKYRKRKIFLIFLMVLCVSLWISSNYIWNVEILAKDNIQIDGIEEELENLGLKKGVKKSSIDVNEIVNNLKVKRDDISWIGIDVEGTNAKVSIVKADAPPNIVEKNEYSNIISAKNGVITKIIARNGTAMVNVGDTIQKGDILIAGSMMGKYTEPRKVHSLGEVKAKVWYSASKKIWFKQVLKENTGNKEIKYEINVGKYKINLYNKISSYSLYKTEREIKDFKFGKNFYLPFGITKIVNEEQCEKNVEYSLDEAKDMGISSISKNIEDKIDDKNNICDKIIRFEEKSNYVEVFVTYEVIEDIGIDSPIY